MLPIDLPDAGALGVCVGTQGMGRLRHGFWRGERRHVSPYGVRGLDVRAAQSADTDDADHPSSPLAYNVRKKATRSAFSLGVRPMPKRVS